MPLFYFNLRTDGGVIPDPNGTELSDQAAARKHAQAVACELMRNAAVEVRLWRLEVTDAEHRTGFGFVFAQFDERLMHLKPAFRATVVDGCAKAASLREAMLDVHHTLLQVKGTIARSKGLPYVAAIDGVRL
jgi:hypothetical protein